MDVGTALAILGSLIVGMLVVAGLIGLVASD